jgi:hypothetical protein
LENKKEGFFTRTMKNYLYNGKRSERHMIELAKIADSTLLSDRESNNLTQQCLYSEITRLRGLLDDNGIVWKEKIEELVIED